MYKATKRIGRNMHRYTTRWANANPLILLASALPLIVLAPFTMVAAIGAALMLTPCAARICYPAAEWLARTEDPNWEPVYKGLGKKKMHTPEIYQQRILDAPSRVAPTLSRPAFAELPPPPRALPAPPPKVRISARAARRELYDLAEL